MKTVYLEDGRWKSFWLPFTIFANIWAATWQNQQNEFVPREDLDQSDQSLRCALNG